MRFLIQTHGNVPHQCQDQGHGDVFVMTAEESDRKADIRCPVIPG